MPKERNVFATRLCRLMDDTGTTQQQLADRIGITRQTISQYMNGDIEPKMRYFTAIADFFNVSADYLLGLSDVKTTNPDIKAVCELTGLSEESINSLKQPIENKLCIGIRDYFISNGGLDDIVNLFKMELENVALSTEEYKYKRGISPKEQDKDTEHMKRFAINRSIINMFSTLSAYFENLVNDMILNFEEAIRKTRSEKKEESISYYEDLMKMCIEKIDMLKSYESVKENNQ